MKLWNRGVAGATAVALTLCLATASHADGPSVFKANKCNGCHTVSAAGITKTGGSDDEGGTKPPDLSHINKAGHPASWFADFLNKKVKSDNGKTHKKAWKGSDADLSVLTSWLAGLK